jgi:hypothetical protein
MFLCVSDSEEQLSPAHDILFWDQVVEADQSHLFVLRRILFGFFVISIHAKPCDSDLFSDAESEKCSPICQRHFSPLARVEGKRIRSNHSAS